MKPIFKDDTYSVDKINPWFNGEYHALLKDTGSPKRAEAWFFYPLGTLASSKSKPI